jgi:hypothetical protein
MKTRGRRPGLGSGCPVGLREGAWGRRLGALRSFLIQPLVLSFSSMRIASGTRYCWATIL